MIRLSPAAVAATPAAEACGLQVRAAAARELPGLVPDWPAARDAPAAAAESVPYKRAVAEVPLVAVPDT